MHSHFPTYTCTHPHIPANACKHLHTRTFPHTQTLTRTHARTYVRTYKHHTRLSHPLLLLTFFIFAKGPHIRKRTFALEKEGSTRDVAGPSVFACVVQALCGTQGTGCCVHTMDSSIIKLCSCFLLITKYFWTNYHFHFITTTNRVLPTLAIMYLVIILGICKTQSWGIVTYCLFVCLLFIFKNGLEREIIYSHDCCVTLEFVMVLIHTVMSNIPRTCS